MHEDSVNLFEGMGAAEVLVGFPDDHHIDVVFGTYLPAPVAHLVADSVVAYALVQLSEMAGNGAAWVIGRLGHAISPSQGPRPTSPELADRIADAFGCPPAGLREQDVLSVLISRNGPRYPRYFLGEVPSTPADGMVLRTRGLDPRGRAREAAAAMSIGAVFAAAARRSVPPVLETLRSIEVEPKFAEIAEDVRTKNRDLVAVLERAEQVAVDALVSAAGQIVETASTRPVSAASHRVEAARIIDLLGPFMAAHLELARQAGELADSPQPERVGVTASGPDVASADWPAPLPSGRIGGPDPQMATSRPVPTADAMQDGHPRSEHAAGIHRTSTDTSAEVALAALRACYATDNVVLADGPPAGSAAAKSFDILIDAILDESPVEWHLDRDLDDQTTARSEMGELLRIATDEGFRIGRLHLGLDPATSVREPADADELIGFFTLLRERNAAQVVVEIGGEVKDLAYEAARYVTAIEPVGLFMLGLEDRTPIYWFAVCNGIATALIEHDVFGPPLHAELTTDTASTGPVPQIHATPQFPPAPPAPSGPDFGPQTLDAVIEAMQLDEDWTTRDSRSVTWWSYALAQKISVSEPRLVGDQTAVRLQSCIDLVHVGGHGTDDVSAIVSALNAESAVSSLVWDHERHVVSSVITAYPLSTTAEWSLLFARAAVMQGFDAHALVVKLHEQLRDCEPMASNHPTLGERLTPDPVFASIEHTLIPIGEGPSRFAGRELAALADRDDIGWLLANGDAHDFTANLPFVVPGDTRTGLSAIRDSSLFQLSTTTPHPEFGSGLYAILRLPIDVPDHEIAALAGGLNRAEALETTGFSFTGSWFPDPDIKATLTYHAFTPSAFAGPGLISLVTQDMALRNHWAAQRLIQH